MNNEEYAQALDKALTDFHTDMFPSQEDALIAPLDLIRQMVKLSNTPYNSVCVAMFGLFLAGMPVTDENIRWLIRDNELGFSHDNELHRANNRVSVYPGMDEFKAKLAEIRRSEGKFND
jgi:hypothetical protein